MFTILAFNKGSSHGSTGSCLLLTSFTVLAAEAVVRVLLVLHAAHLSGCAVLEVSNKPELCCPMTQKSHGKDKRDLEEEKIKKLDIFNMHS